MNAKLRSLSIIAMLSLALAACGQAPEETTEEPAQTDTTVTADAEDTDAEGAEEEPAEADDSNADASHADFKACLVSDAGGWDDKSFNESAFNGLTEAVDTLGVDSTTAESTGTADFGPNVETMVQEGCDLTIGVGFLLEDPIEEAAKANPDLQFGLIDSNFTDPDFNVLSLDNARPLLFDTAQAAFLAGYASAGLTKTGTVGTFGGMQIPSVMIFMDGFADGVMQYNEDNGTDVKLLGWDKDKQEGAFAGTFDDIAQGQTLTEGLINQGADIIMPVAGPLGGGAATAAKEHEGVRIVWVDSDGYLSAPEHKEVILTSVVKEIAASVLATIEDSANGNFTSDPYVGTLKNGGVSLAPFHDFDSEVPAELKERLEELKVAITTGELVVDSPSAP